MSENGLKIKKTDFSNPSNPQPNHYAFSTVSMAHTYGNVTSVISKHILGLFPKNFFKTEHISTKIAYKEFDFRRNSKKEFFRKNKPMIIIRPRILLNDADRFMEGTLLTTIHTDNHFYGEFDELRPFFEDKEKGIYVKYLTNRLSMEFEVYLVLETQMEQINIATYLKNKVRQNMPYMLETALEAQVSNKLLDLISKESGVPRLDSTGARGGFISYLNSRSYYPVTYKMKNSTGNEEHFLYYKTNVETTFSEFSINDSSKKGFRPDRAEVTFNVRLEFNAPGMFYTFLGRKYHPNVIRDFSSFADNEVSVDMFTFQDFLPDLMLPEGFQYYFTNIFICGKDDNGKTDVVSFDGIIDENVKRCFRYCRINNIPYDTLMMFVITKNSDVLVEGKDYTVDYNKKEISILEPEYSATYRMIFYINHLYMNNLIKEELDIENKVNQSVINTVGQDSENYDFISPSIDVDVVLDKDNNIVKPDDKVIDPDRVDIIYVGVSTKEIIKGIDVQKEWSSTELQYNSIINYEFDETEVGKQTFYVPDDWSPNVIIMDINKGGDITNDFNISYQELKFEKPIASPDRYEKYPVRYRVYTRDQEFTSDNNGVRLQFVFR